MAAVISTEQGEAGYFPHIAVFRSGYIPHDYIVYYLVYGVYHPFTGAFANYLTPTVQLHT